MARTTTKKEPPYLDAVYLWTPGKRCFTTKSEGWDSDLQITGTVMRKKYIHLLCAQKSMFTARSSFNKLSVLKFPSPRQPSHFIWKSIHLRWYSNCIFSMGTLCCHKSPSGTNERFSAPGENIKMLGESQNWVKWNAIYLGFFFKKKMSPFLEFLQPFFPPSICLFHCSVKWNLWKLIPHIYFFHLFELQSQHEVLIPAKLMFIPAVSEDIRL